MKKALIISDFDRTQYDTFVQSPSGIGVTEAYNLAIHTLYGDDIYHEVYQNDLGGLKNREPGELVTLLTQRAQERGLHIPNFGTLQDATKILVDEKLSHMLPDISETWPPLMPGFREFYQAVSDGKIPVDFAVLSSGHTPFIKAVYEANGLRPPTILETSDEIRDLTQPTREKYKPHPYQLARIHQQWLKTNKDASTDVDYSSRGLDKHRMLYIGDDVKKDGGLGERGRIPFVLVPYVSPDANVDPEKGQIKASFFQLKELLETNADRLKDGASFAEILFDKTDQELFPPLTETERPYQQWLEGRGVYAGKEQF